MCGRASQRVCTLLMLLLWLVTTGVHAQREISDVSRLREADLLFHVSDTSNAITQVTSAADLPIDHVSIFTLRGGKAAVIEAIGRGVVLTPIDSVLLREGYHIVGRVRHVDRNRSVSEAMRYIGRAYDSYFLPGNDEIYCSELVALSYHTRKGTLCFQPIAMSFHDESGAITPYWQKHYEQAGLTVPEGWPGTNPSELSRRDNVRILWILKRAEKKSE